MNDWAKLSETKEGDTLIADGGFTCMHAGPHIVKRDGLGLHVDCADGAHYLVGQTDDGEEMIGLMKACR